MEDINEADALEKAMAKSVSFVDLFRGVQRVGSETAPADTSDALYFVLRAVYSKLQLAPLSWSIMPLCAL